MTDKDDDDEDAKDDDDDVTDVDQGGEFGHGPLLFGCSRQLAAVTQSRKARGREYIKATAEPVVRLLFARPGCAFAPETRQLVARTLGDG